MAKRSYTIEVDGQRYKATYVGKGQFSRVYRVGDRVVIYTRGDCAKEVLAMYQFDRMAHLPELVRHENITRKVGHTWYVFSSPFYRNVRRSDTSAWALRSAIKKMYERFWDAERAYQFQAYGRVKVDLSLMQRFVHEVKGLLPYSVVKALQEIIDVSSNCGEMAGFDFQDSNFGVNEYGTLIFRDVIFVME